MPHFSSAKDAEHPLVMANPLMADGWSQGGWAMGLAAAWPSDRTLEFIHVPFAAAEEPPTFDPAFYQPLSRLDIPQSVRFIAGCIHESLSSDQQVELLRLIEDRAGREVDVAAACGLGRRPDVSQAWDAMEKALLLVQSPAA
jgi:hypothetical protein